MRPKFLLFLGIVLLSIGILLNSFAQLDYFGASLIIIGVICKSLYIIAKAKNGEYKSGKELIFLALGLLLFVSGMYFPDFIEEFTKPTYLIIAGISLKVIFVLRFIFKIRLGKTEDNST